MSRSRVFLVLATVALLIAAQPALFAQRLLVPLAGTTAPQSGETGGDSVSSDEINFFMMDDQDSNGEEDSIVTINRTFAHGPGKGVSARSGAKAKSNPSVLLGYQGLNFNQQRFANGGNQFSVEPPDQALCVGNGYVVEAVNDVFRVFDANGNPLTGVVDLNSLFGYSAAINRSTGVRGQSITDPVCHFDSDTGQFFLVTLTLNVKPTAPSAGANTGPNYLEVLVTTAGDPTGTWRKYKIPATNDGSEGTPNHQCPPRLNPPAYITNPGACLGDYPHIGADAYGFYITTNEFPLFRSGFHGANIYAMSKRALARGDSLINIVLFDTAGVGPDGAGFTVWPAVSPTGGAALDNNGTEYFLSSRAVFTDDGSSNSILVWALTNTASLDGTTPAVSLALTQVGVDAYAVPPRAHQKEGDRPLGQCISDGSFLPIVGTSCAAATLGGVVPTQPKPVLNSNDSRFQQVSYANGKLWGALDTAVAVNNEDRAGIAYYILTPQLSGGNFKAKVIKQGTVGLPSTDLSYPTTSALNNGRGVISFTLTGENDYPSVGYMSLDPIVGNGDVHVVLTGAGPWDSFTGYAPFGSRPRWGDYGAAAVDGDKVWFAQEYVAQTCTYDQYKSAPFGRCGGTRGSLGNWATGIVQVKP